jgi:voltage-gated potassium channel
MARIPSAVRIERLQRIPLFTGLPERSLRRIASCMSEFEASAGHVLIQSGTPGAGMFVIEEGTVVVESPRRRPVELGPGDFLGELALLTQDGLRTARVRATTGVRGLGLSRSDFDRILREEPRIAVRMLPQLATRLAEASR